MGFPAPRTVALAVRGPIARTDLPGLCERICASLETSGADDVLCDVAGVDPDAVTVDALARLQLAARRHGCQVQLCNASVELLELVAFMGLTDVCPAEARTDELADRPASMGGPLDEPESAREIADVGRPGSDPSHVRSGPAWGQTPRR